MATQTPNLNLTLPAGSEQAAIAVLNDNFEKIDTSVGPAVADTGWINLPNPVNDFSNNTNNRPQYRVKNGVCYLRGELYRGTAPGGGGTEAVTLPEEARPVSSVYATTIGFADLERPTQISVGTSGRLSIASLTTRTSSPGFSIGGISYPVN